MKLCVTCISQSCVLSCRTSPCRNEAGGSCEGIGGELCTFRSERSISSLATLKIVRCTARQDVWAVAFQEHKLRVDGGQEEAESILG